MLIHTPTHTQYTHMLAACAVSGVAFNSIAPEKIATIAK